jgi:hypothetical protein
VQRPSFSLRLIGLWPTSFAPKRKSPSILPRQLPEEGKNGNSESNQERRKSFLQFWNLSILLWPLVLGTWKSCIAGTNTETQPAKLSAKAVIQIPAQVLLNSRHHLTRSSPAEEEKSWKVCDASTTSTCKPEHRDAVEALSTLALTQGYASHR